MYGATSSPEHSSAPATQPCHKLLQPSCGTGEPLAADGAQPMLTDFEQQSLTGVVTDQALM